MSDTPAEAAAKSYLNSCSTKTIGGRTYTVVHNEDGSITLTDSLTGAQKTITVAEVATEFDRRS